MSNRIQKRSKKSIEETKKDPEKKKTRKHSRS